MTPDASVAALATPHIIGCDVGKKTITVFDTATGRTGEIANHADALCAFAQGLSPDCLVISRGHRWL